MRALLQDFVAFYAADPAEREAARARMQSAGDWREVRSTSNGWLVGRRPLVSAEPAAPDTGLDVVFAEGQELVAPSPRVARRFVDDVDQRPWRLELWPGDFTFVRLRAHGHATAARSASGRAPLHYHWSPTRTVITTRFGAMTELAPPGLGLDPLANAAIVGVVPALPYSRGLIRDTFLLPAGHFVQLGKGSGHARAYWRPDRRIVPLPSRTAAEEHVARLREVLLSYLERELDPDGGNLLFLSGGVDSSILAVLARHDLGRPVSSLSLVPPAGHPARPRELGYIEPLAEKLGIQRRWLVDVDMGRLDATLLEAPDTGFHFLHYMLAMVPSLKREQEIRVVFGGEFADDLLGGPQRLPDWGRCAPASTLLNRASLPVGPRDWGRWLKHRARNLLGRPFITLPPPLGRCIAPEVRDEYGAWLDALRASILADKGPLLQLSALLRQKDWLVGYWEAAATVGVRRALPFVNREVLELAAQLHPVELFGPGSKRVLKAAARELPPRFVARSEKGHWVDLGDPNPLVPWGVRPPDLLQGIVAQGFFERPPAFLRQSERSLLQLLVLFAERFAKRRQAARLVR